MYNLLFWIVIAVILISHFGVFLVVLYRAVKRACIKQIQLQTSDAEQIRIETPITYTPEYVWYAGDGKRPLKGLKQEDFLDFERYAHFIYARSHET